MKLCPNCGTDRHIECCSRCGRLVPKKYRGTQFCTYLCMRRQQEEDAISDEMERGT